MAELFPDLQPPCPIILYTDGGCRGNPGPGAWAAVSFCAKHKIGPQREPKAEGQIFEIFGSALETTNNKMELTAVIEGLKALPSFYPQCFNTQNSSGQELNIAVYTDSQYVKNGISTWIENWKKNSWRTSNKKPVKNQELWQELERQAKSIKRRARLEWHWVKGHAGNLYNERCDELVRENFPC